jgi:hypothetical protein
MRQSVGETFGSLAAAHWEILAAMIWIPLVGLWTLTNRFVWNFIKPEAHTPKCHLMVRSVILITLQRAIEKQFVSIGTAAAFNRANLGSLVPIDYPDAV